MQVVSLISITVTNKDVGEVCYKAETVLYLALVKVGFNRDNCCTTECHFIKLRLWG